jgi:hypothetical protein
MHTHTIQAWVMDSIPMDAKASEALSLSPAVGVKNDDEDATLDGPSKKRQQKLEHRATRKVLVKQRKVAIVPTLPALASLSCLCSRSLHRSYRSRDSHRWPRSLLPLKTPMHHRWRNELSSVKNSITAC